MIWVHVVYVSTFFSCFIVFTQTYLHTRTRGKCISRACGARVVRLIVPVYLVYDYMYFTHFQYHLAVLLATLLTCIANSISGRLRGKPQKQVSPFSTNF